MSLLNPFLFISSQQCVLGGSLKLASKSPWDSPIIDPAILKENIDFLVLREAYKSARRLLTAPSFAGYVIGGYGPAAATSDADIEAYIRNFTTTVWHPVGTASMGPASGKQGVVTPDLLVKGVNGLRVVDGSIIVRCDVSSIPMPVLTA